MYHPRLPIPVMAPKRSASTHPPPHAAEPIRTPLPSRPRLFSGNRGLPSGGAVVGDAGCSRESIGGGGGLCVTLRSSVYISGGSLLNNTAVRCVCECLARRVCVLGKM